jgi:hypothetical protein
MIKGKDKNKGSGKDERQRQKRRRDARLVGAAGQRYERRADVTWKP